MCCCKYFGALSLSWAALFSLGQFLGVERPTPRMWRFLALPRHLPPPRATGSEGANRSWPPRKPSSHLHLDLDTVAAMRGGLERREGSAPSPRDAAGPRAASAPATPAQRSPATPRLPPAPPPPAASLATGFSLGAGTSPAARPDHSAASASLFGGTGGGEKKGWMETPPGGKCRAKGGGDVGKGCF